MISDFDIRLDLSGVNGLLAITPLLAINPSECYATTNFLEGDSGDQGLQFHE